MCVERYNYLKNLYGDFVENDIGLLRVIPMLYVDGKQDLCDYLDKQGAKDLFKKLFSLKVIKSKLKFGEKAKIVLFRIVPKFDSFIYKKYRIFKN